jgi:predicted enzyme related to lactoylglutathione lyase
MNGTTPRSIVAFVHVNDMQRSLAFYQMLGLKIKNTFEPDGQIRWAWLQSDHAAIMLARADEPVDHTVQGVLFYVYVDDVAATREALAAKGIRVGPINTPFYAPRGEFRIEDPDGYVLMIMHT